MSVPIAYSGVQFRSTLEGDWAATLNHYGMEWEYEPWTLRLPSGATYMPDFWLPQLKTFIEVKGAHMLRVDKPRELAREVNHDEIIVLLGFAPVNRAMQPYMWDPYLQWGDPLRYDTRLAKCPACSGWQWMRAELSRRCRLCNALHEGVLAKAGEMPFIRAQADRPSWMVRH